MLDFVIAHDPDVRPSAMITELGLLRPMYRQTAAYGHFGRTEVDLAWEHTPYADALRAASRPSAEEAVSA